MNSFRENKLVLFHTSYKDYYITQEKNEKKKKWKGISLFWLKLLWQVRIYTSLTGKLRCKELKSPISTLGKAKLCMQNRELCASSVNSSSLASPIQEPIMQW